MNFFYYHCKTKKMVTWLIDFFLGITLEGIIRYSLDTAIFNHNNKNVEDV